MKTVNTVIYVGLLVLMFTSVGIAGEKASYGLKAGLSVATVDGDLQPYVVSSESRYCMAIGGFATMHQFGNFYLQPEVLYVEKGARGTFSNNAFLTLKLTYIEIPFLLKYKLFGSRKSGLGIYAGPAANLLLSSKLGNYDTKSYTMKIDGCVVVGGSFDIPSGTGYFSIDGRYNIGLTTIDDSDYDLDIKNRVFSLTIGYAFSN